MALDRDSIRTDLGYLSRRRKPADAPAPAAPQSARTPAPSGSASLHLARPGPAAAGPAAPAPAAQAPAGSGGLTLRGSAPASGPAATSPAAQVPAGSGGLTLRGSAPASGPAAAAQMPAGRRAPAPRPAAKIHDRVFPAPAFGKVRQLGAANPVVRLNARQSAIGSLLVTGARSVAWEDTSLITGALHADGHVAGTAVSTPGNRPLVGIGDSAGVVSLRHIGLLRRALFIAGETPLTIGVFDGSAAALAARDEAGLRSVLYAARIGTVLELRAESVPTDASDAAIWAIFGFTMTIPLDRHALRR